MKLFSSMRWRLQFWYGLVLAAVVSAFAVTAYTYERSSQTQRTDAELERRLTAIARAIRGDPQREFAARDDAPGPGRPDEPEAEDAAGRAPRRAAPPALRRLPPEVEASYPSDGDWYYVLWMHPRGEALRSSLAPAQEPRPDRETIVSHGPALRVLGGSREAFMPLGRGILLLVGHRTASDTAALHRFGWMLGSAAAVTLACGLLVGRWLVAASLAPVSKISEVAAKIAGGDLSQRISTKETDSELGQLAETLNGTFARLEAAFAQQSRFTADAAHELRTPVAVLLTHTGGALAPGSASADHIEALQACQRAAQRMQGLIESLMQLARIDSGDLAQHRQSVDLAGHARDCIGLLEPLAKARNILIHAALAPAFAWVDPSQVDQVITNLLGNAIRHNRDAGEVWVATAIDGTHAMITVSDNGPGIAAEHLPRIFDRFYRGDASRSRSSGGAGLGLAIAKAIVEAHGGTLSAVSEPGRGAAFTVRLSLAPASRG